MDLGTGNIDMTGGGDINGGTFATLTSFSLISAAIKSFDIEHPTKKNPWRLIYGVLEGPEHGVYFRGKTTEKVIEVPYYWSDLVHEDSYSVTLTPIGSPNQHFVVKIEDHKIYIDSESGDVNTFFLIHAERKDVDKVLLEYNPTQK